MEQQNDTARFIIPYPFAKHQSEMAKENITYLSIYDVNSNEQKTLAGFIILALDNLPNIELRRIVIAHKGNGLGQLAMLACEAYCKATFDCPRIWLDVFEDNLRGQHIYNKLGYRVFKQDVYQTKKLLFLEKHL